MYYFVDVVAHLVTSLYTAFVKDMRMSGGDIWVIHIFSKLTVDDRASECVCKAVLVCIGYPLFMTGCFVDEDEHSVKQNWKIK